MGLVSPFQKVFDFKGENVCFSRGRNYFFRESWSSLPSFRVLSYQRALATGVLFCLQDVVPGRLPGTFSRTHHTPRAITPRCLIKLNQRATSVTLWITL